jgi:hypothetical protein
MPASAPSWVSPVSLAVTATNSNGLAALAQLIVAWPAGAQQARPQAALGGVDEDVAVGVDVGPDHDAEDRAVLARDREVGVVLVGDDGVGGAFERCGHAGVLGSDQRGGCVRNLARA